MERKIDKSIEGVKLQALGNAVILSIGDDNRVYYAGPVNSAFEFVTLSGEIVTDDKNTYYGILEGEEKFVANLDQWRVLNLEEKEAEVNSKRTVKYLLPVGLALLGLMFVKHRK